MDKDITIYTSNFVNGENLKINLVKKGYKFIEKNISEDITARNNMILKGFRELPILKINGEYSKADNLKILIK